MNQMASRSAKRRTKSGFSQVQKGRNFLQPLLGEYHTVNKRKPQDSYASIDVKHRSSNHQPCRADMTSLRELGFVLPTEAELTASEFYMCQPWSDPCEYRMMDKWLKLRVDPTRQLFYGKAPSMLTRQTDISHEKKMRLDCDREFLRLIFKMGVPCIYREYIQHKSPRCEYVTTDNSPKNQSLDDEKILINAKKMSQLFRRQSCFKARAVPCEKIGKHSTSDNLVNSIELSENTDKVLRYSGSTFGESNSSLASDV